MVPVYVRCCEWSRCMSGVILNCHGVHLVLWMVTVYFRGNCKWSRCMSLGNGNGHAVCHVVIVNRHGVWLFNPRTHTRARTRTTLSVSLSVSRNEANVTVLRTSYLLAWTLFNPFSSTAKLNHLSVRRNNRNDNVKKETVLNISTIKRRLRVLIIIKTWKRKPFCIHQQ